MQAQNRVTGIGSGLLLLVFTSIAAAQDPSPSGKWISNLKAFQENNYQRMELTLDGTKLTGKLGDNSFEGTVRRGQQLLKLEGTLSGDHINGAATIVGPNIQLQWDVSREPPRIETPSKTHVFEPVEFHHFFSSLIPPALHLNPGDLVQTWSVDAAGFDPKGGLRTTGGNPLTGPFFIDGAWPGDTLIVHFSRIRLNRDTATSSPLIAGNALTPAYIEQRKRIEGYDAHWKLDRAAGLASLEKPTENMKGYAVPLAPMLGCVGVAPPGAMQYRSAFLGDFGGNLDYNQLREGVTVYLPVFVPGALLFVGDGHAAQGAGELTGNALETWMDIEFTVDLMPGGAPPGPRLENSDYLMASGIAGSLDDALRGATTNMAQWLERMYGLNAAEVCSVLGTAMVYEIAEVVDPQPHVVAKVSKAVLTGLKRTQ